MHFGEFNPLDVLANAAVQRGVDSATSSTEESVAGTSSGSDSTETSSEKTDEGNKEDNSDDTVSCLEAKAENPNLTPLTVLTSSSPSTSAKSSSGTPYVVKMVTSGKTTGQNHVVALKDATKIVIPNKDGSQKTLTVLKINKGSKQGQTLQYVVDRNKSEDDEGYCSRSSLDSPGQCARSDSESCDRESDVKSPNAVSKKLGSPSVFTPPPSRTPVKSPVKLSIGEDSAKQPAKIVIVSRDSVNTRASVAKTEAMKSSSETGSAENSNASNATVLRTLLGEKTPRLKKEVGTSEMPKTENKDLKPSISGKYSDGSQLSGTGNQGTATGRQTIVLMETPNNSVKFPEVSGSSSNLSGKSSQSGSHLKHNVLQQAIPKQSDANNYRSDISVTNCDNKLTVTDNSKGSCRDTSVAKCSDDKSNALTENVIVVNPGQVENKDTNSMLKLTGTNNNSNSVVKSDMIHPSNSSKNESKESNKSDSISESNSVGPMRKRSGSFQNAFKSFIGNDEKAVEVGRNNVANLPTDRGTTVISANLLSALKQQGHIAIIGESTSAGTKGIMSQGKTTKLAGTTNHKDEEEIIDVTSVDDGSLSARVTSSKTGEKSAPESLPSTSVTPVQVTLSQAVLTTNTNGKTNTLSAKTIPVLINTSSGRRLANVPVSSLLSASTGQSQKPVTYLVMPPQSKATSLLVPQQIAKAPVLDVPKYQYIIQDDVPPVVKAQQTVQLQDVNNVTGSLMQKGNEAWTLLATVNQQGMSSGDGKTKTVPLLIKSPVINQVSGANATTAILQNNVVLSSKAPQSLIPKFVTSSAVAGSAALQQKLLNATHKQTVTPTIINALGAKSQIIMGATENILQQNSLQHSSHSSFQSMKANNTNASSLLNLNTSALGSDKSSALGEKIVLNSIGSVSGGRNTPITGRITPLHSLESSPSENKINIKITGSKVTRTSDDGRPRKASTSIGKFGALSSSWSDFTAQTGSRSEMSSPIAFGSATASPTSSLEPWSPASLHIKSDSELDVSLEGTAKTAAIQRTSQTASKRKNRTTSLGGMDLSAIKSGAANVGRLHPLIDHDYCSFKEFSAEIQSSIIATTDSKQKIEKYNQKAKAARSKDSLFKLDKKSYKKRKYAHRSPLENLRRIRNDKLPEGSDYLPKTESASNLTQDARPTKSLTGKSLRASRRHSQSALERKASVKMRTVPRRGDGKNYVKIPGSYQDDFVYYATKHSRGRSRKHDSNAPEPIPVPKPAKKQAVGGINVFDWYRDLSQTDKSVRFGVPESPSTQSMPDTTQSPMKSIFGKGGHTPEHESEVADLVMAMYNDDFSTDSVSASLPVISQTEAVVTHEVNNESQAMNEVSMAEIGNQQEDIDNVLSRLLSSMDESELDTITEKLKHDMPNAQVDDLTTSAKADTAVPVSDSTETYSPKTNETEKIDSCDVKEESVEKVEENCDIKMEPKTEDEKLNEEVKLENPHTSDNRSEMDIDTPVVTSDDVTTPMKTNIDSTFVEPSDLSALLGPYNQAPNLSQTSTAFDLDEINDDLLQSDISNMNALIGDLARSSSSVVGSVSTSDSSCTTASLGLDIPSKTPMPDDFQFNNTLVKSEISDSNFDASTSLEKSQSAPVLHQSTSLSQSLDKQELFGELNRVSATPSPVQRPPEMITVSMFWNDLPGLMIEGRRCVRLVDIHKQMLPAKDTGILKKRCQMMGLEIYNCNEMERDFLIRYANAAKSKSCVVVGKDDAEALVNFYVNPRPRLAAPGSAPGAAGAGPSPRSQSSGSRESSTERLELQRQTTSGASTPSTESDFEYEPPTPKSTGGKGKGKGKVRPNPRCESGSSRSATPGGGGGKAAKRKQSPLAAPPPPATHTQPATHEGAVTPYASSPKAVTVPGSTALTTPVSSVSPGDASIKRSNRTRAKVNYAALNAGLGPSDEDTGGNDVTYDEEARGFEPPADAAAEGTSAGASGVPKSPGAGSRRPAIVRQNAIAGRILSKRLDSEKYSFPEELEIRRLRNKQKRKGLNQSERRKLRRLKDRLKVKVKKLKKKVDRLKKTNGAQLVTSKNFLVKKALSNVPRSGIAINAPVKSILLPGLKMRLQTTKAAEQRNKTVPLTSQAVSETLPQEPVVVVKTKQDTKHVELVVPPPPLPAPVIAESTIPTTTLNDDIGKAILNSPQKTPVSTNAAPRISRKPSERRASMSERLASNERRSKSQAAENNTPVKPKTPKSHLPVVHRSNHRGRSQAGTLHFHLYRSRESACVQCETCSDFLSVRKFLKHLHHQNNIDELCMVTLPTRLELALLEPLPEQLKMWQQFENKRDQLDRSFEENKISTSRTKAATISSKRTSRQSRNSVSERKTASVKQTEKRDKSIIGQRTQPSTPIPASPAPEMPYTSTPPSGEAMRPRLDSSGTRQSTRVRKRKQLHPMESYVYSYASPPSTEQESKRRRVDSERIDVEGDVIQSPVVACSEHVIHPSKAEDNQENVKNNQVSVT